MKDHIQHALEVLTGLPLWSLGRAADLAWFEFGSRRTVMSVRGEKQVGDYALHVQCPWRMTEGDKIIVGRGDIFSPVALEESATSVLASQIDWHKDSTFDPIVEKIFEQETREFLVESVQAGNAGAAVISLQDGYKIELFPHETVGEHWRLFSPYSEAKHFVVFDNNAKVE